MSDEINASSGQALHRGEAPSRRFQEEYWDAVARTLAEVFGSDSRERLDALRKRVENAKPNTQTAFYHAEPFDVAADLAGRRGVIATLDEKARYVATILQPAPDNAPSTADLARQHPED